MARNPKVASMSDMFRSALASAAKGHGLTREQVLERVRLPERVRARTSLFLLLCEQGFTDAEIARRCGFARSTVSRAIYQALESGER